jgi:hypothetical protein
VFGSLDLAARMPLADDVERRGLRIPGTTARAARRRRALIVLCREVRVVPFT